MKTFWNNLVAAFTMYSKIPMPNIELTEENTKYSLCFFPLVGVIIGAILCGWRIAYPYLCNGDFLPAVVFVIVPVIISGATHVDGFIDTVDAICSKKTVEGKLAILKDTHTGSFAIIMTLSYFLVALGVWSEMPIDAVPVLAIGFVMSRALSGLAVAIFPHARTSKLLRKKTDKKILGIVMAVYIVVCAVLMCLMEPKYGSVGVLGAKHFGGITGAVAAYFVQVCELVIPCVVLVAWKFL